MLHRCLLLAVLVLLPQALRAQVPDTTTADTMKVALPEVTVEAARAAETEASAPFAVTIDTRSPSEVALSSATSLEDVLRPLPGIWVNDRHHFALGERISVRGVGYRSNFGVRGVQVLYDGIPLTLPDGQAFLDVVDPAVVRRVELIRSPASVFWGNGSGGVLFQSSRPPASAPPLRARIQGGSFGRWQGLLEGTGAAGAWTLHGYTSGHRQDGFRAHSQGYRLRAGLNASRPLGPATTLRLTAAGDVQDTENPSSLTRQQFEADPSQARPAFEAVNAGKQSGQGQVGAFVEHDLGGATLAGSGYYLYRSLENPLSFGYITYDRHSGGGRLALRRTTGRLEGGVGLDAGLQSDDRAEFTPSPDGTRGDSLTLEQRETVLSGAAFGYLRYNATDRLALTGGLRVDRLQFRADDALRADGDQSGRRTFSSVSPSLGVTYRLGPARLFAHYSTAFETPTAAELSNRPGGGGGFNQEVDPQRTRGFEVGTRGVLADGALQFDLALYRLRVDDLISSYETPSGREVYDNLAANTHDGIEARLTWRPAPAVELAARYTGSRFVIDEAQRAPALDGNRVPGIPARRMYLHTQVERGGLWARLSGEGVSQFYTDNANTATAPRYVLVTLEVGHRGFPVGGVTVQPFATIENLLDERYASSVVVNAFGGRYYEPGPGRAVMLGLNVSL